MLFRILPFYVIKRDYDTLFTIFKTKLRHVMNYHFLKQLNHTLIPTSPNLLL